MTQRTSPFLGKKLVVFGCGYVGGALAREARGRGMTVTALTRNPETAAALERESGIGTVCASLESDDWHARIDPVQDFVVNCVSSGGTGIEGYRRSYLRGQESINAWLTRGRAEVLLFTGSTSVYPQDDETRVDETARAGGHSERAAILLETEKRVLLDDLPARRRYVFRLAGIYGPGRHHLLDRLRRGEPLAGLPDAVVNAVHLEDILGAVWAAFSAEGPDGIYNVVDDVPERRRVVAEWLAREIGRAAPQFAPSLRKSGRGRRRRYLSNEKLKETFSWSPRYPSYREGYRAILARPSAV